MQNNSPAIVNSPVSIALSHADLAELIFSALSFVRSFGESHTTARGKTYSLNRVLLTWEHPSLQNWDSVEEMCSQRVAHHYYASFVDNSVANKPESIRAAGDLLFPYTYAARSRYWDGGWGYVVQVAEHLRQSTVTTIPLDSLSHFQRFLERASEDCHVQTLMAVLRWLGTTELLVAQSQEQVAKNILERTRLDQLEHVIREISNDSSSRRAVTASFVYPSIDFQLYPLMGIPPYQNYQLLPSQSCEEPLSSLHYHRSLDLMDGILLDIYHDLQWLLHATKRTGRTIGAISILAGNLHVYEPRFGEESFRNSTESLLTWLAKVTDAYKAGMGIAGELLKLKVYSENAERIYEQLRRQK